MASSVSGGNTASGRLSTRRRKAIREQRLAAHRKSLHGRLIDEILGVGQTILTEKLSYRAAHETARPRAWDPAR